MKILNVTLLIVAALASLRGFSQKHVKGQTGNKYQEVQIDTLHVVEKDFSQEVPAPAGSVIKIRNSSHNLQIRVWNEPVVKIVSTISVNEKVAEGLSNDELISLSGVSLKSFGNRVDLLSWKNVSGVTVNASSGFTGSLYQRVQGLPSAFPDNDPNIVKIYQGDSLVKIGYTGAGVTDKDKLKEVTVVGYPTKKSSLKALPRRRMVIYIPAGSRLDLDNAITDVVITDDLDDAEIKLTSSNLAAKNFGKLRLVANSYTIYMSDVKEAQMELALGSISAGEIGTLELDSRSSEIEYTSVANLFIRSENDRIIVDEIMTVSGHKQFGELRIGKLTSQLDLNCRNSDIKIRKISEDVSLVKISDKYASLRIPITLLPNFSVDFKGQNTTMYTGFDNRTIMQVKDLSVSATGIYLDGKAPDSFTAQVGTTTGKHTKFSITCDQCTVDFK